VSEDFHSALNRNSFRGLSHPLIPLKRLGRDMVITNTQSPFE
jgi:hypothetical protein